MDGFHLRVELHKDRLYPVGNRVARVVDIVEVFAEGPGQDVVMVLLVGWISPTQHQKHGQRGTQAEKVLNSGRRKNI